MVELKIIKVGSSLGMHLPREILSRMYLEGSDRLILTKSPEGGYRLTRYDPEFEKQMRANESCVRGHASLS